MDLARVIEYVDVNHDVFFNSCLYYSGRRASVLKISGWKNARTFWWI